MASELSPRHQALIEGSAITHDVAAARGYRTVTVKAELKRLGFGDYQSRVPALLVPVWGVTGEIVTYQLRPDEPRIRKGKALKYETPASSRMALDVPPQCKSLGWLDDPSRPLFITEGARKADAGVSMGLCTIALLGVWNWRGSNEHGGTVALSDWESVALKNRLVFLVFDSDVTTKPEVHRALARLREFLQGRGAGVKIVYLPNGGGGAKLGLDDFFATGATVDDLLARAESDLRPAPQSGDGSGPYLERDGCTFWKRPTMDGPVYILLANFTARIETEAELDDGQEVRREYEIRAQVAGRTVTCSVPAVQFPSMGWVDRHLGVQAVISPGMGLRDHLRVAIQVLSKTAERRTVYVHSGWRELAGHGWCYLHADGAIGPNGPLPDVGVQLPGALCGMTIPPPPGSDSLGADVRAALEFVDLGPPPLTIPLLAAAFRASMGDTDFSICVFGVTDSFKTETATCVQAFYGTGFTPQTLPGSWLSTANANETLAFIAKDALVVVDDFVPGGSSHDVQKQHREGERLLRAQGNRAGRARLGADAMLRAGRAPRGMILTTGEELPARHSARARTLVLEFSPGDVTSQRLSECQARVAAGVHARVMAAFLVWVARRYPELKQELRRRMAVLRAAAQSDDRHRRTATIIAELQAGLEVFLAFAVLRSALTDAEAAQLQSRSWEALKRAAEAQVRHQRAAEPARLFLRLLRSALASGEAHIADCSGGQPDTPEGLGWRQAGSRGQGETEEWVYRAFGARVGWVDGDEVYLDADAALKVAQEMASDAERIPVTTNTLAKRLHECGFLASTESTRGHLLVRRVLEGVRRPVLHLRRGMLAGAAQSAQSAQSDDGGGAVEVGEGAEANGGGHDLAAPSRALHASSPRPAAAPIAIADELTRRVTEIFSGEVVSESKPQAHRASGLAAESGSARRKPRGQPNRADDHGHHDSASQELFDA